MLQVQRVLETVHFYQDVLGFRCDYRTETYGVVWRDNAALHFTQGASAQHGVKHFFWLIDVNAYYSEVVKKNVKITTRSATEITASVTLGSLIIMALS